MPPPIRRSDVDACPGALRLHAAADGPLARVRLPGGRLTGDQLAALGDAATRWGDGHLELTSRANVQLRALTSADPAGLAAHLSAAGLLPSPAHELVRNIAAPPLSGADLVRDLDRALCADPALTALPGRFLFAVGPVPLAADLAALPAGDGYAILFAGVDAGLRVPRAEVVPTLLAAAHAFLNLRERDGSGPAWRLAELPDGPARVAAALGRPLTGGPPVDRVEPTAPIGVLRQDDGLAAVGALVPLGRLTPAQVDRLSAAASLVVTPWRGMVLRDLPPAAAAGWSAELAACGLPVEADSRWSGVTACAGRPGCAKSLADVRADALAATRFVDGLPAHWVGCARGCGSPAGPHVRVEATPDGWSVTAPGAARAVMPPPEPAPSGATSTNEHANAAAADQPHPTRPGAIGTNELADVVATARRR